jgi:hypothetical protein
VKSPPLTVRLVLHLCVTLLISVQVLGLHYHHHGGEHHAATTHAIALHLWDGGLHAANDAHVVHSGPDMDINQPTTGLGKRVNIGLMLGIFLVAILWLPGVRLLPVRRLYRNAVSHPDRFVLRPPSRGPPLKLSLVR